MNYILNLLQGMFEMNANPKDACIGFHKAFAYKWNRMKRKKSKNIWEIVCGAKDEITKPTIMFFVLVLRMAWKNPEIQSRKSIRKKVSRRLLEKSQLFVFMVKAPQTSNQFQKSLELYQIYVTRNICPGQPQSEWFSIENEFIVTKNSNKKLTIKKEQIQFLFKAANRSKGNTEQCVFP